MKSLYIQEMSVHTVTSFSSLLAKSEADTLAVLQMLLSRGVVRPLNPLSQKEAQGEERLYEFRYVGLIVVADACIAVYPKYIATDSRARQAMPSIVRAIQKCYQTPSLMQASSSEGELVDEPLAAMLNLMDLFSLYGVYTDCTPTYVRCREGRIDWGRTVTKYLPAISGNDAVYFDYVTRKTAQDPLNLITRIHQWALTECSSFLRSSGLGGALGIADVSLSIESAADFGDNDTILALIDRELRSQFVLWKSETLEALKLFFSNVPQIVAPQRVLCLGTTAFYHVWEIACREAFRDIARKPLMSIGHDKPQGWNGERTACLIDLIPKPTWHVSGLSDFADLSSTGKLIPDAISMLTDNDSSSWFLILDAKYYQPTLGVALSGVPGVESVIKQFMYQSAFRQFVNANKISHVVNAFLMPHEGDDDFYFGSVSYKGVVPEESSPFSNQIDSIFLSASKLFESYLDGSDGAYRERIVSMISCHQQGNTR